ncbi:MAG: acetyl-CoA carboxylase biotin carboxyl carrier protein subunit [Bacteroidales bacterium]|nr:acetyl-CoA carboxylase biotin carboxyl carrier protein subunit [Bacteroidales bacterium]
MPTEDYKEFFVNGEIYKTRLCKKFIEAPKWEKEDLKKIYAFIPGTIREIYFKSGKSVKKGDCILILEAMKMRNRVKAPIDGKIKIIHVKENQVVSKNYLLIEIV